MMGSVPLQMNTSQHLKFWFHFFLFPLARGLYVMTRTLCLGWWDPTLPPLSCPQHSDTDHNPNCSVSQWLNVPSDTRLAAPVPSRWQGLSFRWWKWRTERKGEIGDALLAAFSNTLPAERRWAHSLAPRSTLKDARGWAVHDYPGTGTVMQFPAQRQLPERRQPAPCQERQPGLLLGTSPSCSQDWVSQPCLFWIIKTRSSDGNTELGMEERRVYNTLHCCVVFCLSMKSIPKREVS